MFSAGLLDLPSAFLWLLAAVESPFDGEKTKVGSRSVSLITSESMSGTSTVAVRDGRLDHTKSLLTWVDERGGRVDERIPKTSNETANKNMRRKIFPWGNACKSLWVRGVIRPISCNQWIQARLCVGTNPLLHPVLVYATGCFQGHGQRRVHTVSIRWWPVQP